MKTINLIPSFENSEEKDIVKLVTLLSIFFGFLPTLIIYFAVPEKLSVNSKKLILAILNFEIILCIVSFICSALPFIFSLLAFIITPALWIFNLIICLKALSSVANETEVAIPDFYQFITIEK